MNRRLRMCGRAVIAAILLLSVMREAAADGGVRTWQWLGPGNTGGIVRAIVIHPTADPLRIVVASPGGGIWLTNNGGASWTLTDGFLPSMVVSCMDQCVSNPNVLYAGTGESFANRLAAPSAGGTGGGRGEPGAGILKSTDGGATWSRLASTQSWAGDDNKFVNFLAVHPTNPDLVLVATDAGIQRSTDGGLNWDNVRSGRVTEVKWVTTFGFAVAGLENKPATRPALNSELECALFSQDFGATWTPSTFAGTPASTTLSTAAAAGATTISVQSHVGFSAGDSIRIGQGATAEGIRVAAAQANQISLAAGLANPHLAGESVVSRVCQRTALAVTPGGSRVYASMGAGGGSVWRSTNSGQSYSFVGNPNPEDVNPADADRDYLTPGGTQRAFYSNVIWAAPRPPPNNTIDIVAVAGVEGLRSLDGGVTFQRITEGVRYDEGTSAHIDFHAIVPDPRYPDVTSVYFGNDGGVQRADNIFTVQQESGWTNLASNFGLTQLHGGKATPDGDWFFGCGQDIDAVIRGPSDGINGWDLWNGVGDSRGVAVEPNPPTGAVTFYNLRNNELWKLTDGGASSAQAMNGISNPCGSGADSIVRAIALDPNNPSILAAGGFGLWRTTDRAANWSPIRVSVDCGETATVVEIAAGNSNLLWAGYTDGRVSRTNGSVSAWIDVNTPGALPACGGGSLAVDCSVSDIFIDPENNQRVFVTFTGSGYDFRENCAQNVFVTTDGGGCWTPLMGTPPFDLPVTAAWTISMHPDNSNWLYVGTDQGVYASEDGGATWGRTPLFAEHEGPYNGMVRELSWHDPDYLVAATYGLGMHRARVPETVFVDRTYAGAELGTQAQPFNTVQEGINLAGHGADISIRTGTYDEAGANLFRTRGMVLATGGIVTIR